MPSAAQAESFRGAGAQVCIVGAGASGIAMAKALVERQVPFDLFEGAARIGGLWVEEEAGKVLAYRSLHMNSSKRRMQFSDYPMPASYPDFPSRDEVAAYLAEYARHFGVYDRVALGCNVSKVDRASRGGWDVEV